MSKNVLSNESLDHSILHQLSSARLAVKEMNVAARCVNYAVMFEAQY
jgi:hypothetical protein